jgi:uncharacterized protein YkwD
MPSLPDPGRDVRRRGATLALSLALVLTAAVVAPRPAAATTTTSSVATALLQLTNADRAALGLRPLRADSRLAAIARDRGANLTVASAFGHDAAGGSLSAALDRAGIQWYLWAEDLAFTTGGLRSSTAARVFSSWKQSPRHWAALMSPTLNYVGFGVAVRARDGRVFASGVFTESRDHTPPTSRIDSATRDGAAITFAWHGYDAPLQSHWAGLRDFDVWYRVDGGAWRLIRDNTTTTTVHLGARASGHRYWLMVRARDRALNVGRTSTPRSIWVP